jgi:hypothetical protein
MPRSIRHLLVPESVLLLVALLVFASDSPKVGWLINPHSDFGGSMLLVLLGFCAIAFGWLVFVVPGAVVGLVRGSVERTSTSISVVCACALLALIYGGWFVHAFVLRS